MDIQKQSRSKIKSLFLPVVLCLGLVGCHSFVKFPTVHSVSKQTAATKSIRMHTGIGSFFGHEAHWLHRLQKDNVQVVQTGDRVRIIIPSDTIFFVNSAAILPQGYPVLLNITRFIENYGSMPITVSGYTDNVGPKQTNIKLSDEQAKSVIAFLWSHGVPFYNLRPHGYGSSNSVASNNLPFTSAYNRRIELTFWIG